METAHNSLIFTVDVECWGQSVLDRSLDILEHSADNVRRMMNLLADADRSQATFFVLGKFAEKHPDTIRELAAAGHEIASHGYSHIEIFRMTRDAFREDLRRAGGIIGDITGHPPRGFRAPVFSIRRDSLWALGVLADEGYTFDSSIFPFQGRRYGIGDWPIETRRVRLPDGQSIIELPLTVLKLGGRRLPISGGGYARLLPNAMLWNLLRRQAERRTTTPVFYCHPYETDTHELSSLYPNIPLKRRLNQGLGRRGFTHKLQTLLQKFDCVSCSNALATVNTLEEMNLLERPSIAGCPTPSRGGGWTNGLGGRIISPPSERVGNPRHPLPYGRGSVQDTPSDEAYQSTKKPEVWPSPT